MKWRNYIESISKEYLFKAPATNTNITLIKKELNVELPEKLLELLRETNGIFDKYECPLIWSTEQIVEDNLFLEILMTTKIFICLSIIYYFFQMQVMEIYSVIEY